MPSIYFLISSFRKWPPEARGALFKMQPSPGLGTPQDPLRHWQAHSWDTWHRGSLFPRSGTHPTVMPEEHGQGPPRAPLLTWWLCVLLASFPVHHGWIRDGQFAVVLLSDNCSPGPRQEDSCDWGEEEPTRTFTDSCAALARGLLLEERDRPALWDSLAVGTSLSSHVWPPEASNKLALAITDSLHLLKRKNYRVAFEENLVGIRDFYLI